MAGARIEIDDRELHQALMRLVQAGRNPVPALREIGEALLISHHERFDAERAPDGSPWAPLSDETLRRKMLRGVKRTKGQKHKSLTTRAGHTKAGAIRALAGTKTLVLDGYLKDLLRYQVTGASLELGTDRIYGATHQFGDPKRHIPARPFLGVSASDRAAIAAILTEHLRRALAT